MLKAAVHQKNHDQQSPTDTGEEPAEQPGDLPPLGAMLHAELNWAWGAN